MTVMNSLENLRSNFINQVNLLLTQQRHTYHKAAKIISVNDQLQQDIFEQLMAVLHTDDLTAAKKAAAHALHACNQLDSSIHFLLSQRTHEQKAREDDIQNFNLEFNKTIDNLAGVLVKNA